jgi:hypothetical protein
VAPKKGILGRTARSLVIILPKYLPINRSGYHLQGRLRTARTVRFPFEKGLIERRNVFDVKP